MGCVVFLPLVVEIGDWRWGIGGSQLVRHFVPCLPDAKHAGQSRAQLASVDLRGLPWLPYINLTLSEPA